MEPISFCIRLTSDAEPGTGLGGEVVNELVPRNHRRQPILPASHVKGLMRAAWREISGRLGWPADIEASVFGSPDESRPGLEAAIRLSDAVATKAARTHLVTRTAVSSAGVASDRALRTTESVPVATQFRGQRHSNVAADTVADLAWRLALLTISAVGGNRNRGSGRCVVTIDGESRGPGEILQRLAALLAQPSAAATSADKPTLPTAAATETGPAASHSPSLSANAVVLELIFRASTPICCPEIPDKTNVISTGFSIPASAVQGMVLNRLGREHPELAQALFESPTFRAWPLQPCSPPIPSEEPMPAALPVPIRVSLTHRAAKFSTPGEAYPERFYDEALAIEPYDWTTVADGAPLKASDGVLLRWPHGDVQLWKHSSMPHVLTSHGVHGDPEHDLARNLFTVDAMAPMIWQGLLVVPQDVAQILLDSWNRNPQVALGKSRSVRGSGCLQAHPVDGVPAAWRTQTEKTVLVVQSPVLLPDRPRAEQTAEQELAELAGQWAQRNGLPHAGLRTWASVGIQFGWNRHRSGLQRACRVVLPGSVIAFDVRLDEARLAAVLKADGLGDGRERGFGAVSVHPGKATNWFEPSSTPRTLGADAGLAGRAAMKLVLAMRQQARQLPSPSQIRAVQQRLLKAGNRDDALAYLDRQTQRTSRIWFIWETILPSMRELLKDYDTPVAARALETLADLAILDQKKGNPE